jgi:hypothetical protein
VNPKQYSVYRHNQALTQSIHLRDYQPDNPALALDFTSSQQFKCSGVGELSYGENISVKTKAIY